MDSHERAERFNRWAATYDDAVAGPAEGYPHAGYDRVLKTVFERASASEGMSVLDLGTGTGNLAARFTAIGCRVWGIDFSAEMLERARRKLPTATLGHADLLGEWPPEFDRRFDRIVSAYVLHHFDLDTKIAFLRRLVDRCLVPGAPIVAGDVAFATVAAREAARARWRDRWVDGEYYWAADETAAACERAGLSAEFVEASECAGVFVFRAGR